MTKFTNNVRYATGFGGVVQNSDDLRVKRTRKMLQNALLELTVEKGFADLTIREIAERAMVNRSTFYRHYLDKYDLLSQYLEEQVFQSFNGSWESLQSKNEYFPELVTVLQHVQEHSDFYRVMMSEKGDPGFCSQRLLKYMESGLRERAPSEKANLAPQSPPVDLRIGYAAQAGIGAITWWLQNDQPCSPEQIAKWLYQLGLLDVGLHPNQ